VKGVYAVTKVVPLHVNRRLGKQTQVRVDIDVRWSDIDNRDCINDASVVTVIGEARNRWLCGADAPTAMRELESVTAELHVEYRRDLQFEDSPLDVVMWTDRVGTGDFTVVYEVRPAGSSDDAAPAVTATTRQLVVDFATQHERRLTHAEREYLRRWQRDPQSSPQQG
jgi:acyl-CoA thioester hydrolase